MKEKDYTSVYIWIILIISITLISSVLYYYNLIFKDYVITADSEHFAQFGDFIGGTLNPILAFLGFIALLYTIKLQSDELKATRYELEKSTIAQEAQSKSLELQNKATEVQIFENTFFELLKQHNEYLKPMIDENEVIYIGFENINFKNEKVAPLSKETIIENFKKLNQEKKSVKSYFRILFQILKFIDNKSGMDFIDRKFYSNLLRALIDDEVLRTLALNCISYDFKDYKKYIEKYEFFEHIYIEERKMETETILNILNEYKPTAFGKNHELKELVFLKN